MNITSEQNIIILHHKLILIFWVMQFMS